MQLPLPRTADPVHPHVCHPEPMAQVETAHGPVRPGIAALARRYRSLTTLARTVLAIVSAVLFILARWNSGLWRWNFEDLEVYRSGAAALEHAHSLYAPVSGLPFTYPPFAAVVFEPLHAVGSIPSRILLTALSLAGLSVLVRVSVTRAGFRADLVLPLCIAALALEPVLRTLRLGQVNLVLAALVVLDCFVLPAKHRGWLVGIAAGIKLVPGVFILYFMVKRDWPAAARSVFSLGLTIVVSFLVDHRDAQQFWIHLVYDPQHVGGVAYVDNQSVLGVVVRLTHQQTPPHWLTLPLEAAALALACWSCRVQLLAHQELAAFTCIAIGGLLASPISWSHHWVWLIPAIAVVLQRKNLRVAGTLVGVSYLAPHWFTPYGGLREFNQNPAQQVLSSSMCIAGVLFLVWLARKSRTAMG